MRIKIYLNEKLGNGKNITSSPHLQDSAITKLFANSIVSSVKTQLKVVSSIVKMRKENERAKAKGEEIPHLEKSIYASQGVANTLCSCLAHKDSIFSFNWGEGTNCVVVDVWHSPNGGSSDDYCKIGVNLSDASAGVRETNLVFELARIVHAAAYMLVNLTPPPGFEEVRNIHLIKDYVHPKDNLEELYITRNADGSPQEVVLVPKQEKERT